MLGEVTADLVERDQRSLSRKMGKNSFEFLFTAAATARKTVFACQNEPNPPALGSRIGSHSIDEFSKIVGRTGFEPVTSSVSGKSRVVPGVCHGWTASNGEPLTCAKILGGSRWVRGHLNTLAPIPGSHRLSEMRCLHGALSAGAAGGTWRVREVAGVGEAEAGVAGCAPAQ